MATNNKIGAIQKFGNTFYTHLFQTYYGYLDIPKEYRDKYLIFWNFYTSRTIYLYTILHHYDCHYQSRRNLDDLQNILSVYILLSITRPLENIFWVYVNLYCNYFNMQVLRIDIMQNIKYFVIMTSLREYFSEIFIYLFKLWPLTTKQGLFRSLVTHVLILFSFILDLYEYLDIPKEYCDKYLIFCNFLILTHPEPFSAILT